MGTVRKKKEEVKEVWKSPPSINRSWIEVSNLGRVRTLDHEVEFFRCGEKQRRLQRGRIRKLIPDTRGRPMVFLHYFDKKVGKVIIGRLIRSLVAECFCHGWRSSSNVFHRNGDVKDCRASNLIVGEKRDRYRRNAIRMAQMKITLKVENDVIGEFCGFGEAARFLGVTKQAVNNAYRTGSKCCGCKVTATGLSEKDRVRIGWKCSVNSVPIPESLYTKEDVFTLPKPIFRT